MFASLAVMPLVASSADLSPVKDSRLATVLALSEEISPKVPVGEQPYFVRLFAAPVLIGECGGTVSSCPNVRLFVAVTAGDLGETPVLYELPTAKGWEFIGWDKPVTLNGQAMEGFTVKTALPESNVDASARNAWRPKVCRVFVSPVAASYTCL
jgi:hypothetical protein